MKKRGGGIHANPDSPSAQPLKKRLSAHPEADAIVASLLNDGFELESESGEAKPEPECTTLGDVAEDFIGDLPCDDDEKLYTFYAFVDGMTPSYIGCTFRADEREMEHWCLSSGAPRLLSAFSAYGRASYALKTITQHRCKRREAEALETFLMERHDTLVTESTQRTRDRLAHANCEKDYKYPDILLPDQPRSYRLNARRSCGDHALVQKMGELYESKLAHVQVEMTDEEVEALAELVIEDFKLVQAHFGGEEVDLFKIDTPFMLARKIRRDYEKLDAWTVVPRDGVTADLNRIKDFEKNDAIAKEHKVWMRLTHSNGGLTSSMTAQQAVSFINVAEEFCANLLETQFAKGKSSHYLRAVAWRKWMAENDGRVPRQIQNKERTEVEDAENKLATQIHHWKNGHGGPKFLDVQTYLVVLRHFIDFEKHVHGKTKNSNDAAVVVNRLLRDGFGLQKIEPGVKGFPSTCHTCQRVTPAYNWIRNYVDGANTSGVDVAFNNLASSRVNKYKSAHDANVPKHKEWNAKSSAKRTAARAARRE